MDTLEKEMNEVRQEITATKADLAQAKAEGDRELITSYVKLLAGLQKKENTLMQAAGKQFIIISHDDWLFM